MKDNDACFASLQDSNEKLCGFLDWLLDAIEVHNCNPRRKTIIPPSQQLEHAVPTLSCVMNCQMGVAGQADMLKGHFTRAKQLQADLYNRTATQYM